MQILHLKTQRGQPYGSVRRCCEICGTMLAGQQGEEPWTDDPKVWDDSSVRCLVFVVAQTTP